jgi:hypothetical protein
LENIADETLYLLSDESTMNNLKEKTVLNKPKAFEPEEIKRYPMNAYSEIYKKLDNFPKVVNNQIKYTISYKISYEYKGKKYELVIPKQSVVLDVKYPIGKSFIVNVYEDGYEGP